MKITLKLPGSYPEFYMAYKTQGNFKRYFYEKKKCTLYAVKYDNMSLNIYL